MERIAIERDLVVRKEKPFNAGPSPRLVRESYLTPNNLFFIRNHGDVPKINPDTYRLSVSGLVHRRLDLSLKEIREDFPKVKVVSALQCAGNRRMEMMRIARFDGEVPWDAEAVSNAEWAGASLGLVLQVAGISPEARHIAFSGLDEIEAEGKVTEFGGSVPRDKAMSAEVILAYEMNGEPLPESHGYPLRVIVPGYIGARSVKWLGAITAQSDPSESYFYTKAYKLYPPWVTAKEVHLHEGQTLLEQKVNSVICQPADGEKVLGNPIVFRGQATTGGNRKIERVEISADGGLTWIEAIFTEYERPWGWCFWECELALRQGSHSIAVRAWDSAGETQPSDPKTLWNFKGYMNNSWHRVRVEVE